MELQNTYTPNSPKAFHLTEPQIRYAMANTLSNADAANWLHVGIDCWKRYASSYIDETTGKSLYELHKTEGRKKRLVIPKTRYKKRTKPFSNWFEAKEMTEIFANKYPTYSKKRFQERLTFEGWMPERCSCCGFQERRHFDWEVPLKLHFVDGNTSNYALANIQLLCFNCYFINVGNPWGGDKKFYLDPETGDPIPVRKDKKSPEARKLQVGFQFETKDYLSNIKSNAKPMPKDIGKQANV
jgi:hypothetical protein